MHTDLPMFNECCVSFDRRDLPMRPDVLPIMLVENNGHAMVAFLNGELVGESTHNI